MLYEKQCTVAALRKQTLSEPLNICQSLVAIVDRLGTRTQKEINANHNQPEYNCLFHRTRKMPNAKAEQARPASVASGSEGLSQADCYVNDVSRFISAASRSQSSKTTSGSEPVWLTRLPH